ncbi:hypothetical protein ACFX2A_008817 [Malus domestica]
MIKPNEALPPVENDKSEQVSCSNDRVRNSPALIGLISTNHAHHDPPLWLFRSIMASTERGRRDNVIIFLNLRD